MARVRHENAFPARKDVSESAAWEGCGAQKFAGQGEAQVPGWSTHKSGLACLPNHILAKRDFGGSVKHVDCIFAVAMAKRAARAAFHPAAHLFDIPCKAPGPGFPTTAGPHFPQARPARAMTTSYRRQISHFESGDDFFCQFPCGPSRPFLQFLYPFLRSD